MSDRLNVSPSSVTEMFERLATDGLIEYEEHRGVELTPRGREIARELVRRQRLVRRFFRTELGVEISAEASYRIGFVLPEKEIERLREPVGS